MELLRAYAIAGHEQTAGETRLCSVKAMARDGLPRQSQLRVNVTKQFLPQRRASQEFLPEARGAYPQGVATRLNYGANKRIANSQCNRHAEHTFIADEPNFHRLLALNRRQYTYDAVGRKVYVSNRPPGLV
jgi:hypothetical protein